jgi:16S rRNA (cytidine1402-2'-O)-methyltransferase
MGDRKAVVARELTKLHEEVIRGSLSDILELLETRSSLKGEHTLLVGGNERTEKVDTDLVLNDLRQLHLETGRPLSDLVKEIAGKYGISRKVVYDEALKLKKEGQITSEDL